MRIRKWIWAVLSALSVIFFSCSHESDDSQDHQVNETPLEDGKTYIEFQNQDVYPVQIYQDPSRLILVAEVPAKETVKVEASPNLTGVAFYPVFLLTIEGISITLRVDEKNVNQVTIPVLETIKTGFAYIKIENSSLYSLTLQKGGYELTPLDAASTIVMPGETSAYRIEPQEARVYSFMQNASSPIAFPDGIQEFVQDTIYSFKYDGTRLMLRSTNPMLPAPQNLALQAGDGSIIVTWDAIRWASSCSVYYSVSETPPETPAETAIIGTTATIRGLTNNTVYYVWVASVNSSGYTMSGAKSITLILPAPQNLALRAQDRSITVHPADPGRNRAGSHRRWLRGSGRVRSHRAADYRFLGRRKPCL
jgi:hypothetical protein